MMIEGHKQINYNVMSLNGLHEMLCTPNCVCVRMHVCTSQLEFCIYIQLQEKEFSQSLRVSTLSFSKQQVFIIWKWTWEDEHAMETSSSSDVSSNPDELEEPSSEPTVSSSEDTPEPETNKIKHSVVFKCVGVKKEKYIEKVLISASRSWTMANMFLFVYGPSQIIQ